MNEFAYKGHQEDLTKLAWSGCVQRTTNPKDPGYRPNISLCERWRLYENFREDMKLKPSPKHRLSRKDKSLGFEPNNCEWVYSEKSIPVIRQRTTKQFMDSIGATNSLTGNATERKIWYGMLIRCFDKRSSGYHRYKDRAPSADWLEFANFYRDMGSRPGPEFSLEREDNSKPYSKDNCIWATIKEQSRNKSSTIFLTFKGETKCKSAWIEQYAENLGLSPAALGYRLDNWPIEVALSSSAEVVEAYKANSRLSSKALNREFKGRPVEYEGQTKSIGEWCEILGLPYNLIRSRIYRGKSLKAAMRGIR